VSRTSLGPRVELIGRPALRPKKAAATLGVSERAPSDPPPRVGNERAGPPSRGAEESMAAPARELRHLSHAEATLLVMAAEGERQFGKVVPGPRGKGWRIDVRPYGYLYGIAGRGFADQEIALGLLNVIRIEIAEGASREAAVAPYLRSHSAVNRIANRYARWVEVKEAEADVGDLSPRTVQEYRRYARRGGEVEWWEEQSVFEITTARLKAWNLALAKRGLSPATRKHVLGAFRTFMSWLREEDPRRFAIIPEFPTIRVPEHEPVILTPKAQEAILGTFTEVNEWLSHALAGRCGLRSGEVRALAPGDYRGRDEDGVPWLSITKAMQTLSWDGEPGPTKNKRNRTLPIPADLADAIESLWPASARLAADKGTPMLVNSRTNRRWSHWALRASWLRGCESAGAPPVPLYEGTKHSGATDMLARTKDRAAVRDYLGHTDARSTDKYAKVTSGALVDIAKRKKADTPQ